MLSRTAGALYWMSRYLERSESVARLVDVNLSLSMDLSGGEDEAWAAVVATTGDLEPFLKRHGAVRRGPALAFLAFDPENPNSVASCVHLARENARTVREHLPSEAWEAINALYLNLRQAASLGDSPGTLEAALEEVRLAGRQLDGLLATTLVRDEGWQFSQLGQHLERADQTSRLVDVQHALLEGRGGESGHELRWEAVAKSAGALTMYRRRHGGTDGQKVAEFLLLDGAFPRSVSFCLRTAEEALRAINGTPPGMFSNAAEKGLGRLAADLRYTEIADVLEEGIHSWLDRFQQRLNAVGDSVLKEYFEPPAAPEPDQPPAYEHANQQ
ncbi:MAG TPA: alpha-E domain-containing protein [bacterium]|jgi:uncharacterized alpha-E superfamily protein|nr:alpha-E domain-containing protein [bacterium]